MREPGDISEDLRAWAWDPAGLNARMVPGADGRGLIQVRLELGLLQMELTDRPDGQRPEGLDSWLAVALQRSASSNLDPALLRALREETLQVFQRIWACVVLGEQERVLLDADENLRRMDLCLEGGQGAEAGSIESLRPQAIMLRSRAGAELAIASGNASAARQALTSGLEDLERCLPPAQFDLQSEVQALRGMHTLLVPRLPASQRVELQTRLARAVEAENFELAAILRNEIRQLLD